MGADRPFPAIGPENAEGPHRRSGAGLRSAVGGGGQSSSFRPSPAMAGATGQSLLKLTAPSIGGGLSGTVDGFGTPLKVNLAVSPEPSTPTITI